PSSQIESARPQPSALGWILGEPSQGSREGAAVADRCQQRTALVLEERLQRVNVGRDDGQARRERFERSESEALGRRREREQSCCAIQALELIAAEAAQHADTFAEAELAYASIEAVNLMAVVEQRRSPGDHEQRVALTSGGAQLVERLEQGQR